VALSFCDADERQHLKGIQKLLSREIDVLSDHPFPDGHQRVPMPRKPQGPAGKMDKPGSFKRAKKPARGKHPLAKSRPAGNPARRPRAGRP
jgi:ATP-dependent RNA helicase RhlE